MGSMSSTVIFVLTATFLASAVEAIEMVVIVVGVGASRGYRSSLSGAAGGLLVLAVIVAGLRTSLAAVPINALRIGVGALLLVFGLQWLTKGVRRVAAHGLAGIRTRDVAASGAHRDELDWTAFVLSFKGVLLEGLEIAFIVVSFGATANQFGFALIGGSAAIVVIGAIGFALHRAVTRIPRSLLQLLVGIMLTTFGTFWSLEGIGVDWPAGDAAILLLLFTYALTAATYIVLEWRRVFGLVPNA